MRNVPGAERDPPGEAVNRVEPIGWCSKCTIWTLLHAGGTRVSSWMSSEAMSEGEGMTDVRQAASTSRGGTPQRSFWGETEPVPGS
jgi:hypothetical protein